MDTAERAARARVEAVFTAVDRLTPDDLGVLAVPARDLEERTVLLADLEAAADRAGRGVLLDEARASLRDGLSRRAVARFQAETGVSGMARTGRSEDLAGIMLALEDAVSVAVAEDLLAADDAADLAEPGRRLLGLEPLPGSPAAAADGGGPAWEPSAADWAAAAHGPAAADAEAGMEGGRTLQAAFFAGVGGFGVLVALAAGVSSGDWLLPGLGAVAVVALAWTFATYHRPIRRP